MDKEELEKYKKDWGQWTDDETDCHVQADIAYQLTEANEYRESALTVERAKVEQLEETNKQLTRIANVLMNWQDLRLGIMESDKVAAIIGKNVKQ